MLNKSYQKSTMCTEFKVQTCYLITILSFLILVCR